MGGGGAPLVAVAVALCGGAGRVHCLSNAPKPDPRFQFGHISSSRLYFVPARDRVVRFAALSRCPAPGGVAPLC